MSLVDGRFRLGRMLGSGGMGRLFAAVDEQTGEEVALKQLMLEGDDARQRFEREAVMLSAVSDPNVVRYVAHGQHGAHSYLAMELVRGETVAARILREGLAIDETVSITRQVVSALGAIHRIGLVHRDIKPSNLMVPTGRTEPLKLVDFGLVRNAAGVGMLTGTGMAIGSPGYMSPEQARGDRVVTPAVDVYALGCVLYLALTGLHPFPGDTAQAVQAKILTYEPPPPVLHNPECPAPLSRLAMQMLSQHPDSRPRLELIAHMLDALGSVGPTQRRKQWRRSDKPAPLPDSTIELLLRAESFGVAASLSHDDEAESREVSPDATAVLQSLAERFGANLGVMRDGTCALTSRPDAAPSERALMGAQLALELRKALPDWSVALALGPVDADVVVDRALSLLHSELLSRMLLGPGPGVRIDEDSANRLEGQAQVQVGKGARYLLGLPAAA